MIKDFFKSIKMNEEKISRALGALVVIVVGILVYNYFTGVNKQTEIQETSQEKLELVQEDGQIVPKNLPVNHVVAKGEHLWMISEKYYGSGYNWVDIAQENQLKNPDVLTEGQNLIVPRTGVKEIKVEASTMIDSSDYTVEKGDHLWSIAVRSYGDGFQWTKIWEANKTKISNPNLIEPGMVLTLPR